MRALRGGCLKKLGTLGLMADAGCHMALLESLLPILSSFQIVHSYILMDSKKIPEDVDIMVVEGGIRTKHDEDWVRLARKRKGDSPNQSGSSARGR